MKEPGETLLGNEQREDSVQSWLAELAGTQSPLADLLRHHESEQRRDGYLNTLAEICQQPVTWRKTAGRAAAHENLFAAGVQDCRMVVFTGSGSSEYAGNCVQLAVRNDLQVPVDCVPAALILTHGSTALPPLRPGLLVSLARSGDSPESCAAVRYLLETEPDIRHLVITSNPAGRLVTENTGDDRVRVFVLDECTCDRGLAMTSSFTNLVLGARFLGMLGDPEKYVTNLGLLAQAAKRILTSGAAALAGFSAARFTKALFLGSGCAYGAARESALKMLELTAGRVTTMAETPLGLRHGPMSWVDRDTAVICFLSSDLTIRAYECDLLAELDRKGIGVRRVLAGDGIRAQLRTSDTVTVESPELAIVGDSFAPVIHVLAGQLLAFFRCLEEKLKPDTPSESGIISRVVGDFKIHVPPSESRHI